MERAKKKERKKERKKRGRERERERKGKSEVLFVASASTFVMPRDREGLTFEGRWSLRSFVE